MITQKHKDRLKFSGSVVGVVASWFILVGLTIAVPVAILFGSGYAILWLLQHFGVI